MCTIYICGSGWVIQTPNKVSILLNLNKLCFYYLDTAMWLNICYHRLVVIITCKISDKSNNAIYRTFNYNTL